MGHRPPRDTPECVVWRCESAVCRVEMCIICCGMSCRCVPQMKRLHVLGELDGRESQDRGATQSTPKQGLEYEEADLDLCTLHSRCCHQPVVSNHMVFRRLSPDTARGSFTTPFLHPSMLNVTNKHVRMPWIRILHDSRAFAIRSASGCCHCRNAPQARMIACDSVLQHHFAFHVFVLYASIMCTHKIQCAAMRPCVRQPQTYISKN